MARLQCRSCGFDQEIEWDGRLVCPSCGATNARVAAATAELSDSEVEMIMQGDFPERQRQNSDHVEKAPAMVLRCLAYAYEFRTGKEIAAWQIACPNCGHRRVGLADCVQDIAIDLKERTMEALPPIATPEDYDDA